MSKITNGGLIRSDTGCFVLVCSCTTHMATVGVRGLTCVSVYVLVLCNVTASACVNK